MEINRIYNQDCTEGMKEIENGSVSLVLADHPYEISRESGFQSAPTGRDTDRFRISIDFGDWDSQQAFDIYSALREAYRCLRKGGFIVCFYDLWKISILKAALENAGFTQLRFIEWVKTNPVPINSKLNYLTNSREIAVCAVKGSKPTFNSEYDNGIYRYPICHDKGRFHPTQKPLDLIRDILTKHSNDGDLVLDFTMGSGTTAVAAILENRNFIGFELNKDYFEKAQKRIILAQQDLQLWQNKTSQKT